MHKRLKLKPKITKLFKNIFVFLLICLIIFFFYRREIESIKKYGYSEKASLNILYSLKVGYIKNHRYSKTLNRAFEENDYTLSNLEFYSDIKYVNHKNLIKNIDKLLKLNYKTNEISMIISSGSEEDVLNFIKKGKVRYIEEYLDYNFSKLSNYDRYIKYSDDNGTDDEDTVVLVNLNKDKNEYQDYELIKKYSVDMLINRHFKAIETLEVPLVSVDSSYIKNKNMSIELSKEAYSAFKVMYNAAKEKGLELRINTGYVSYDEQEKLQKEYLQKYKNTNIALAGFSEHQTGLAIDVASASNLVFKNSKEYNWMLENCYEYGFIPRFVNKYRKMTEFREEPWHFRYVGKKISNYIKEHPMAYEEYYARFVDVNSK